VAIDAHSSIHDEFVGASAGCNPGIGNDFVQAKYAHF
jgi:hypothetical protein